MHLRTHGNLPYKKAIFLMFLIFAQFLPCDVWAAAVPTVFSDPVSVLLAKESPHYILSQINWKSNFQIFVPNLA
jgi:energy-coupling factor transporter transmembrane protein EcfT